MKKIEIGALIVFIASIFFFRLYIITYKEKVEIGDVVEITGRVDAGKGRIETIDGKYFLENTYFLVNKVEDGEKIILGDIENIKNLKWGTQYKLNVQEVRENKNIFKEFFIMKIKKISENYTIGLENFLRATILGEGHLIDNELKELFRYTGTAHLLVISGLHIGVIISGIVLLLLKLKISKRIRYFLTFLILSIYVLSIGKSPSVLRSYIMGGIYLLGNVIYEKVNTKKSFLIAFIISLLIYPTWIYSISFWMSYVAVFSIIFIYQKLPKFNIRKNIYLNKILNSILLTIVVQISMTPIFYIFFKNIPLLSFFTNILLIPIASIFIIIGFITLFLSNFYLEFLLLPILNYSYIFLIESVQLLSRIPYLTLEL